MRHPLEKHLRFNRQRCAHRLFRCSATTCRHSSGGTFGFKLQGTTSLVIGCNSCVIQSFSCIRAARLCCREPNNTSQGLIWSGFKQSPCSRPWSSVRQATPHFLSKAFYELNCASNFPGFLISALAPTHRMTLAHNYFPQCTRTAHIHMSSSVVRHRTAMSCNEGFVDHLANNWFIW